MKVPQLQSLLTLARQLDGRPDVADIFSFVKSKVESAGTPSMAQSVCSQIIDLCHPKAWGDRMVAGIDNVEWCAWLSAFAQRAEECGQAIYTATSASSARGGD